MSIMISGYAPGRGVTGKQGTFSGTGTIVQPEAGSVPVSSVVIQNNSTANVINVYNTLATNICYVIPTSGSIVLPVDDLNKILISGTSGQAYSLLGILR